MKFINTKDFVSHPYLAWILPSKRHAKDKIFGVG